MNKLIFTVVITIFVFIANAKNNCYYRLQINDCSDCLSKISSAKSLTKFSDVYFVFNESCRKDSIDIFEKLHIQNYPEVKVLWSDSIMGIKPTNSYSDVLITSNYGIHINVPLKKIDENIDKISSLGRSDTLLTEYKKGKLDYNTNLFIFNWINRTLYEYGRFQKYSFQYKLDDSLVKQTMYLRYGNNNTYNLTRKMLDKNALVDEDGFITYTVYNDTIFVLGRSKALEVKGTDSVVKNTYSIYKFKHGNIVGILPIIADGLLQDDYFLSPIDFIFNKKDFYFSLSKVHVQLNNNKILALFKEGNSKLIFSSIMPDTMSETYFNYRVFYNHDEVLSYYPYYIQKISNEVRNIDDHKVYKLNHLYVNELRPTSILDIMKQRSGIWDFKIDKNFIFYFIIVENETFYYVKYDPKADKLLYREVLGDRTKLICTPVIDKLDNEFVVMPYQNALVRQKIKAS